MRLFTLIAVLILLGGCGPSTRYFAHGPSEPDRPLVLHLPGIDGPLIFDSNLAAGLADAGVAVEFRCYDWTHAKRGIGALRDHAMHRREAAAVAARLAAARRADARRPIVLSGESGGAAIAVFALEALPADVSVDSVLLLAPALSPRYDLSRALRHVRGKCHVYPSRADGLVLGWGTRTFGTMDGVKTDAAGRVGFVVPAAAADRAQYAKLVEHPYRSGWSRLGDSGDHTGTMSRPFVRGVIAPLLMEQFAGTPDYRPDGRGAAGGAVSPPPPPPPRGS